MDSGSRFRNPTPPIEAPASDRLESWKEIAAYLSRDESTARRWERREGLPVHRHEHATGFTVYAYRHELDAWRATRRPENGNGALTVGRRWWRQRAAVAASLGITLVAVVGTLLVVSVFRKTPAPPLEFGDRDWVLITDFENSTGEAALTGAMESVLTRELDSSRFVNVVPPERVVDVLALMQQEPDARIDRALGLEISQRDGAIRAVLTGRAEKLGSTYIMSTSVVDPGTSATVASVTRESADEAAILAALREIADEVRTILGQSLPDIAVPDQRLASVTTPSLRALQLYSQAEQVRGGRFAAGGWPIHVEVEERLLREAIEEDPAFASAHLELAFALRSRGRPSDEYRPVASRAFELAETSSEPEQHFIVGSFYWMSGRTEEAVLAFETLLSLYPDHYSGVERLRAVYRELGKEGDALRLSRRLADLRPNDFSANAKAASDLVMRTNDAAAARPYATRAWSVAPEWEQRHMSFLPRTELFPVYEHWLQGDVGAALLEADRVAATLSERGDTERWTLTNHLLSVYNSLGKFEAARELVRSGYDKPGLVEFRLGQIAAANGDETRAREHLQEIPPSAPLDSHPLQKASYQLAAGRRAVSEGRYREAIPLLEDGLEPWLRSNSAGAFENYRALAETRFALEGAGAAVMVLEEASRLRGRAAVTGNGYFIRNQWWLSTLYRDLGRTAEADSIEADLVGLLAVADSDHSILREIKARRASPVAHTAAS